MQVKNKLRINIAISIITALLIILMLFLAFYQFNRAIVDLDMANEILSSLYTRNALALDYLRTGSGKAKEEWLCEHGQTGELLNSAAERFGSDQYSLVIDKMIKDHKETMQFFLSIVENREKARAGEISTDLYHEIEDRLLSQAGLRLYQTVLNINLLRNAARKDFSAEMQQTGLCVALFILLVSAAAAISSWTMSRTITSRIRKLREGARIIGEGRLDHRISIKSNDEFAELSDSFDAMTEKLSLSYHELENEISERKRVKKEREELIRKLESANLELEGFTYSVSHDLRAPIRHLSSYARLLEKESGRSMDEKSQGYLKIIIDASIKLGKLVDELLEFSRMGRTALAKSEVDLNRLVREIINLHGEANKSRNIEWKVYTLPVVCGDSDMLQLVISNLISNSIKYTGQRAKAYIEIGSEENELNYIIYIKDNGIGFDMKYYDKLFGIFQRLHTSEEYEGTGIGLANVKRIIQRHGGKVWATSRVDEGATFYLSLPKK